MTHDKSASPIGRPTAVVITLGCKVNQFESAALRRQLTEAGYVLVERGQAADLTVINTCTVTSRADQEARTLIRQAHRLRPEGRILVTGCLAQVRPEDLAELPGVYAVCGHGAKEDLLALLDDSGPRIRISAPGADGRVPDLGFPPSGRTRAFFRVQDGCSGSCAYCAVPAARGPSRSMEPERVRRGVETYAGMGYSEVVLTGIHLGTWGEDLRPPSTLPELVAGLIAGPGPRIRLSSVEPLEVTPDLAELFTAGGRLCPHLHVPIQSGSNRILEAMGRPYRRDVVETALTLLASGRPDICLGADFLVGFPGEDEEAFAETLDLAERLPLAYFHVFPFSPRPGTRAADMPGRPRGPVVRERAARLRRLGRARRAAFAERAVGSTREVLVQDRLDPETNMAMGIADNYLGVSIDGPAPRPGRLVRVRITEARDGRVTGRVVEQGMPERRDD